ncbi:hypothetical protein HPP92_023443 [Vanilla planifolia]|uniref:Uncharacterized protein n=1 Tax=Vanilla planifolia TaxID=51239 RepID=A0A835UGR6_VANPL|nr:hypothetical protein HPP92_023443 [Vanilla planifolia]
MRMRAQEVEHFVEATEPYHGSPRFKYLLLAVFCRCVSNVAKIPSSNLFCFPFGFGFAGSYLQVSYQGMRATSD